MLADAVSIPNLFRRSGLYFGYLYKKHLLGLQELNSPATTPGEAGWLFGYGLASFSYRLIICWLIIVYVLDKFYLAGLVLALWLVSWQILRPVGRGLWFVFTSPALQRKRVRVIGKVAGIVSLIMALIFYVPMPSYSRSEGVVWMPDDAQLRVECDGFVDELPPNLPAIVEAGTAIVTIINPLMRTEVDVLKARLIELDTQFRAEWESHRVKADTIRDEMKVVVEQLQRARQKQKAMAIVSKKTGKLLIPDAEDLPGRYVHQGDVIGYVLDDSLPTVRVVVTQAVLGRIQENLAGIQIRLVNQPARALPAKIIRRGPEATNALPSPALATINGGNIVIDSRSEQALRTREKIFQLDLAYSPVGVGSEIIGQRVYVRFDHGAEPLARQWYRSLRQVFLRHFNG
nr:hypothetical protein [Methylomarinum sp. Ch1-1]MDP4519658.1 hypothetical protein [Methylomarinum sp. Ch1-1]